MTTEQAGARAHEGHPTGPGGLGRPAQYLASAESRGPFAEFGAGAPTCDRWTCERPIRCGSTMPADPSGVLDVLARGFGTGIYRLDYSVDPEMPRRAINAWVRRADRVADSRAHRARADHRRHRAHGRYWRWRRPRLPAGPSPSPGRRSSSTPRSGPPTTSARPGSLLCSRARSTCPQSLGRQAI